MSNCAIVGINWGDEGKGRMVDLLTSDYDVVVRYQGGGNAGHTVASAADGGKDTELTVHAIDYDVVRNDLDKVIQLVPDFEFGYYNRANLLAILKDYRAALADYDEAIRLRPDFADAYFNRGLTHIFLGNNKQGIQDLSKAGELGIFSAYNIIKRFTDLRSK